MACSPLRTSNKLGIVTSTVSTCKEQRLITKECLAISSYNRFLKIKKDNADIKWNEEDSLPKVSGSCPRAPSCQPYFLFVRRTEGIKLLPIHSIRAKKPPVLVPEIQSKHSWMGRPNTSSITKSIWVITRPLMPPPSRHSTRPVRCRWFRNSLVRICFLY
ncbi:hypothetical protein E2C01_027463 [Portunus trituberculatus]|uniref:Uncharacterized protein n=1 Tax=Portunus trituberculatus TaxID=210409 RepID=A0A5B7ELE4_PORTR|nr:hypothetical protein [Portunus trituberculatus]